MFRRKTRDETWCTATRPQAFVSQQSPQDFVRALERRMRPGQFSEGGLLGPSEGLLDRLEADDDWLRRHEITHEQIADRLETVTGVAEHAQALVWESAIKSGCLNDAPQSFVVYDRLDVEITAYCGSQECPFSLQKPLAVTMTRFGPVRARVSEPCGEAASEYVIRDRITGRSVFVPKLAIHLIRDHHFFQGDTLYRVDPAAVVALLEIKPNFHYTPRIASEPIWELVESSSEIGEDHLAKIGRAADSRVQFDGGTAYRIGDELVLVVRQYPASRTFPLIDGRRVVDPTPGIARYRKDVETFHVETPWAGRIAEG